MPRKARSRPTPQQDGSKHLDQDQTTTPDVVVPGRDLSRFDAALAYLAKGWVVVPACEAPCSDPGHNKDKPCPGKRALVTWETRDSVTVKEVRGWWSTWPDANLAILTGARSGLVVVDLDGPEGEANWAKLEAEHGPFPATYEVKTKHGRHLYFEHPGPAVKILTRRSEYLFPWGLDQDNAEGVDVRGDGGLVIAPPHRDRELSQDLPLAPLPAGLVKPFSTTKDQQRKAEKPAEPLFDMAGKHDGAFTPEQAKAHIKKHVIDKMRDAEKRTPALFEAAITYGRFLAAYAKDDGISEEEQTEKFVDNLKTLAKARDLDPDAVDRDIRNGIDIGKEQPYTLVKGKEEAKEKGKPKPGRKLRIVKASEIKPRATRWLWEETDAQWIALGGLTLLGGREGIGKTTIGYQIVGKVTRGTLPGSFYGTPRPVVISATEDAWEQTVIPRLMAADADLELVYRVDAETPEGAPEAVKLPEDLAELETLVKGEGVALVLLDPLMGSISGTLDSHKDHDIRIALEPVSRLAHEAQVSIIGLIHENKTGGSDLLNRIMASRAFTAVARGVLMAARDTEEIPRTGELELATPAEERFLFGQAKSNLGRRVPHTLKYHIEGRTVGHDDELDQDIYGATIVWDGKVDDQLQDIVNRQEAEARVTDRDLAKDQAADWLIDCLEKWPQGLPSSTIKKAAEEAGHKPRTLQRVLHELGVRITKEGTKTYWSLPGAVGADGADDINGADGAGKETTGPGSAPSAPSATRAKSPERGADPFELLDFAEEARS